MSIYENLNIADIDTEEWRPVREFPTLYMVSNLGRIKSLTRCTAMPNGGSRTTPDTIMSQNINSHGYLYVNLTCNGVSKSRTVHRMVGLEFVNNPNQKLFKIINHKKGFKLDNRASELEWTDHHYNNKHAYDIGLKQGAAKGKFGKENHCSIPINQYTKDGVFIRSFAGQQEATRLTGIRQSNISEVLNYHNRKTAGGFIWRFAQ